MNNTTFTFLGFLVLITLFLLLASGRYATAIITFLSVVLLSMILINWRKIEPLFIRRV